jgi:glycosyltransferase involved in cell wall biosynthesis
MKQSPIHVAVVVDAWFPSKSHARGTWGSRQVHVRELTKKMASMYPVEFTVFFPAYSNFIYNYIWIIIALVRIIQHHKRNNFKIIHAHGINASVVGKIASLYLKIPLIQTVHGSGRMDLKQNTPMAWFEKKMLTKTKYTSQITVTSSFLKYENVNKGISIIPNGVSVEEFDEIEVEKNLSPTIIWVGRDTPTKGLKILRTSILKIRKKIPDLKTKLITGGAVTGKALIKAYKKAHVFVLPSLAEGQPITLLEAWAAKLPVVVTDVGDNSQMVKNGVNGYIVDPGNVLQLTNALLKTLRARTKNTQMGEAGYSLVKNEYSLNHVAVKTWEVYQSVLNGTIN